MKLIAERWYPFVTALVVAVVYLSVPSFRDHVLPETTTDLLTAVVSVAGIAVGFLATAKAILISVDDKPIVQRIKEAKFYQRIITYLRHAIRWSFLLTIVSAACLLFSFKSLARWDWPHAIGTAVWLFLAVGSIMSYHRIAKIWYAILRHLDAKPPQ